MADDWQLEAVQEQFKLFKSLTTVQTQISPNDVGGLINKVKVVVQDHLRPQQSAQPSSSVRKISATIISNSADEETFHFAFILIVTNTHVNNSLYTTPVFAITSRNKLVFIDTSCNVYKSWTAFMKNNNLPQCQFCFPVNGKYSVGGKLKIDFAKSPAYDYQIAPRIWRYATILLGSAVVVGSFFFHIPLNTFAIFRQLIPVAGKFIGSFERKFIINIMKLSELIQHIKKGSNILPVSVDIFKVLADIYSDFQEEIKNVWNDLSNALSDIWCHVSRIFWRLISSSPSSLVEVVAITSRINDEIIDVSNTAEEQLLQTIRANQYEENVLNEERVPMNRAFLQVDDGISSPEQLFVNCRNESTGSFKYKSQNECLSPMTVDLLKLGANISENIKVENLNDITDILLTLKDFVQERYKNLINNYTKGINAARVAAGHEINLVEYNKSLGIKGDPKIHLWNEALQELETSSFFPHICKAVNNFKKNKKVELIQFNEENEEDGRFFYKCIGVRKENLTLDVIGALKNLDVIKFDENELVINETETVVFIRSSEFTAFYLQPDNEPSRSDGVLYLQKENTFARESCILNV